MGYLKQYEGPFNLEIKRLEKLGLKQLWEVNYLKCEKKKKAQYPKVLQEIKMWHGLLKV